MLRFKVSRFGSTTLKIELFLADSAVTMLPFLSNFSLTDPSPFFNYDNLPIFICNFVIVTISYSLTIG